MREIVNKDEKQIEQLLKTLKYITQALGSYHNRVQNTTALAQEGRVPDLIGEDIMAVSFVCYLSGVTLKYKMKE